MRITPKSCDGCRIDNRKNYFEWWYFDLDLRSKQRMYIEWWAPIFNLRDEFCMLVVRVHHDEATKQDKHNMKLGQPFSEKAFRYPRTSVYQSETECRIVFTAGQIVEQDNGYLINIEERNLLIDLVFERCLPPLILENEVLYSSENGEEFFSWCVPLPKAMVRGRIKFEEEDIQVDGTAYHDHNWGNINIGRRLGGWIWTRLYFSHLTVIFADITVKEVNSNVPVLILLDKEGRKINVSLSQVEYLYERLDKLDQMKIPAEVTISFSGDSNYKIHLGFKKNSVTQEFPLASSDSHRVNALITMAYYLFKLERAPSFFKKWLGRGLYFQFSVIGELYVNNQLTETGSGVAEVLLFGV